MTEDITPTVLRQIREDIANLDQRMDAGFAAARGEREEMRGEITSLRRDMTRGFAHTNEQLSAVVALMGRLAKSDEHLEARIDALEARLVEP